MANELTSPNGNIPFVTMPSGTLALNSLRLLQQIVNALNPSETDGAMLISLGNGLNIYVGTGSPNGAVTDSPGAVYLNSSGGAGTTLYVKESGANTNTGWVGK